MSGGLHVSGDFLVVEVDFAEDDVVGADPWLASAFGPFVILSGVFCGLSLSQLEWHFSRHIFFINVHRSYPDQSKTAG